MSWSSSISLALQPRYFTEETARRTRDQERTQRQRDEAVDGAREVLVGNKISPGNPVTKPDGHGVVTGVCRGYNRAGGAAHPHSNIN